jgi:hypothetical protein
MRSSRFITGLFLFLTIASLLTQVVLDFSLENLLSTSVVVASALLILGYIHWTPAVRTHPLSTFAIFGLCVTTQLGALLVQSFSGESLVKNLRQPLDTFSILAFYQLVAIVAHAIYRNFRFSRDPNNEGLLRSALRALRLYETPAVGALWVIGIVGLLNLVARGSGEGIGSKVSQGLSFLAWAPFLIPMYRAREGAYYCNARKNYLALVAYVLLVALFGLAINARGIMLSGLMTIAVFFLLMGMRSDRRISADQVLKGGVVLLIAGLMTIPLSDLATAMAIARKDRGTASAMKMIENTLHTVQQPHLLQAYRDQRRVADVLGAYDETYLASPLMGRLIETKFHDNALYFGARLTPRDVRRVEDITGDFLWATLPTPILEALEVPVNKSDLQFSMGDYISHLSGAGSLGGFKTGSVFAQGHSIFGPGFPLVYIFMCLVLFWAIDLLAFRAAGAEVVVSALGMLVIWKTFQYGITAESLQYLFIAVVRNAPQNIILYLLVFYFAKLVAPKYVRAPMTPNALA